MVATTVQIQTVSPKISAEVLALALNKEIAAQVLAWDSCGNWDCQPSEITNLETKGDMLRFRLTDGRATVLSADQFLNYWEQIKVAKAESEPNQETIVALAKQQGTAIWEQGTKLGYVAQYHKQFYAVSEMLVHGRGFQYSYSRHSSFQMAVNSLIEQSWIEDVA